MIAVDTNIIIRFLTQDDIPQYKKAYVVFKSQDVFISDTVVQETEWVLRYAYEFSREEISLALASLFGLPNIYLSNPGSIAKALEWYAKGLDFSDALHLISAQQCAHLYTFDKKFIAKANGLSKCLVQSP